MDKEAIKAFIAWLEEASLEEIHAQQDFIEKSQQRIHTQEGRADAKLALRLIDEELLARMNLRGIRRDGR